MANEIDHRAGPERVLTLVADITQYDDCKKVMEQSLDALGAVEVLVNNACHITMGQPKTQFWEADLELCENQYRSMSTAPFLCPVA